MCVLYFSCKVDVIVRGGEPHLLKPLSSLEVPLSYNFICVKCLSDWAERTWEDNASEKILFTYFYLLCSFTSTELITRKI